MNNYKIVYHDATFTPVEYEIEADGYFIASNRKDALTFFINKEVNLRSRNVYPSGVLLPSQTSYTVREEIATFFDPISVILLNKEYDPEQQPHTEGDI